MQERKFLDLDHICDEILDEYDRKMFNEAIRCYQIDSHRAAVILAWSVTADCLFRRIDELATENDGSAQAARTALAKVHGTAHYEEVLITQAKICDLLDDYEEKSLRFARDTRSKCAHPTGVVPSAEAVRHILHICSQIVLCRNGFRGISFVKDFVNTKLKDRHLFSNSQRINEDCCYFSEKVSERVRVQFGAEITKRFEITDSNWLRNVQIFLQHLFTFSSVGLAKKVAMKLQGIEGKDRLNFSIIVGLAQNPGVWEAQEINQSKGHLREALTSGKIDEVTFYSYGNLCALSQLEVDDQALLKSRFGLFVEHISKHMLLQAHCGNSLISLVIDGLSDEDKIQEQILKGLSEFSSLEWVFSDKSIDENTRFINALIQADWLNENIANTWQRIDSWSSPLLGAFLSNADKFLLECSEDSPDYVLTLFDAISSLIVKAPNLLPNSLDKTLRCIVEKELELGWYSDKGESYRNFIGQVNLLKDRYSAYFPLVSQLVLPTGEGDEEGVDAD